MNAFNATDLHAFLLTLRKMNYGHEWLKELKKSSGFRWVKE